MDELNKEKELKLFDIARKVNLGCGLACFVVACDYGLNVIDALVNHLAYGSLLTIPLISGTLSIWYFHLYFKCCKNIDRLQTPPKDEENQ